MSAYVVDASVALSWCFDDEASAATNRLLELVRDDGAMVPGLWHLELANILLKAERRGRISSADVAKRLELISALPIMTDQETAARAWRDVLAIARADGLTTYDAAYLELAMRRGLKLLTRDAELAAAAVRRGIKVLPVPADPPKPGRPRRRKV